MISSTAAGFGRRDRRISRARSTTLPELRVGRGGDRKSAGACTSTEREERSDRERRDAGTRRSARNCAGVGGVTEPPTKTPRPPTGSPR